MMMRITDMYQINKRMIKHSLLIFILMLTLVSSDKLAVSQIVNDFPENEIAALGGSNKNYLESDSVKFKIAGRALLGEATDIAVEANYAYVALSTGMIIFDISQPDLFKFISNTYLDPGYASFCEPRIFKENNHIFFTTGNRLYILDISDPALPEKVSSIEIEESKIEDVIANNQYIYLGDSRGGKIHILSFNGIDTLDYINFIPVEDVRQIDLSDDLIYVADGFGSSMRIFSVADPMNPVPVGAYTNYSVGSGVCVRDSLAFFSNVNNGLIIINVKDPKNPFKISEFNPIQGIIRAVADEQYVYTSSRGAGFKIVDISDPYHPFQVGGGNPGGSNLLITEDKILYVAQPKTYRENIGIIVFNVNDPFFPVQIGSYITGSNYNNINLRDDLIYVTGWDFGIQIFPDDDIYQPKDIQTVLSDYQPEELIFHNDIGFLFAFEGIYILDCSDPLLPVLNGFIDTPYEPQEIQVINSLLYVACGVEASFDYFPGALQIYDISNPRNPRLLSSIISPRSPFIDMELYDHFAFVIDQFVGIRIFYIYDANHPFEVFNFHGDFNRVTIDDTFAYVSGDSVLYVFDLQNGRAINLISQYALNTDLEIYNLFVKDNFLFMNDRHNIYSIDISNPTSCYLNGQFYIPDYIESFFMSDNIYISTYQLGIYILSYVLPLSIPIDNKFIPTPFRLFQNYPNPFNPSTKIEYFIPISDNVSLEIYNTLGQKIKTLLNKYMPAGYHVIEFNAQNLPSGVYFCRIKAGEFQDEKKMILLR